MFIIVPIICILALGLWANVVLFRNVETIQAMKNTTKLPVYIKRYNDLKKLKEEFCGPGSWKRTIDYPANLMSLHARCNTIAFYTLMLAALVGLWSFNSANYWIVWHILMLGYGVHIVYIERYNKENQDYYKEMLIKQSDYDVNKQD